MHVYLLKLNGWPSSFDERIEILSQYTELTIIRSAPNSDKREWPEGIRSYDLLPRRGTSVSPSWLKPIVFPLHVLQAIILSLILMLKDQRRPDVIHAFDYALGGAAGAAVSLACNRPLVISVRGYKEAVYKSRIQKGGILSTINYRILRILTGIALSQAKFIITKAGYQRELIGERIGKNVDIATIPTGVDFEIFSPLESYRDQLSALFPDEEVLSTDRPRLLHLGKLTPEKGVDKFVSHAVNGQNFDCEPIFVLVGDVHSTEFLNSIEADTESSLADILIHGARVPFDDIPGLIASVDAVVLLSEPAHEGVPRVLQEACAMQTPIIASDVRGINNEFKGLPGCILINRESTQDFVEAVNKICKQDFKMDRDLFKGRFDINDNYSKYKEIYREASS